MISNLQNFVLGVLHDDLQLFLEANLPKSGKKKKILLGVADAKVGSAIAETVQISVQHTGSIPEIIRGMC